MKTSNALMMVGMVLSAAACAPHAPPPPRSYTDAQRGVRFDYPGDWKVEDLRGENVLLVSCPVEEAGWQTNVFIEMRPSPGGVRPPETRLAEAVEGVRAQKKNCVVLGSRVFPHGSGVTAGEMTYTHEIDDVPLTEREVILWFNDGRALYATGSAATRFWSKYEGSIRVILDSLRLTAR